MSLNRGSGKRELGLHPPDRPDRPVGQQGQDPGHQRVVAVVEGLHHHEPGAGRRLGDRAGLVGVAGERLLAEHVLTGRDRGQRPLCVQPVGQRDVDRVERRVGEHAGVVVVHRGDAVPGRGGGGPAAVPGREGGHRDAVDLRGPAGSGRTA